MKVLCLSDIHGVEWYIDLLIDHVKKNEVEFNCVVVGGDMGRMGDTTSFYRIMHKISSLGKKVFYCLGNWDNSVSYVSSSLESNCVHVHDNIVEFDGYYLAGFSGCNFDWGMNPIPSEMKKHLNQKYSEIIDRHQVEIKLSNNLRQTKINDLESLKDRYEKYRELAIQKHRDKRTKAHKKLINRLNIREEELDHRARYFKSPRLKKFHSSEEYQMYINEKDELMNSILNKNVMNVVNSLKEKNIPLDRLIFIAHERIDKFAEYFDSTPLCHMFGHRHGYISSYRSVRGNPKGGKTNYINISSLDVNSPKKYSYCLPPNYVIAEFNGSERVKSNPVYLDVLNSTILASNIDERSLLLIIYDLNEYYLYHENVSRDEYEMMAKAFLEFNSVDYI